MLDVLVTCHRHALEPSYFPEVRGYYLAKHLARSGLQAEFRSLPAPGTECRVLICSEYQCDLAWFERLLAVPLSEISAERLFCLGTYTLGDLDHFSRDYLEWFRQRGGILFHLEEEPLGPREHWIGLGADIEVLGSQDGLRRDTAVFDFAELVNRPDAEAEFDPGLVEATRRALPDSRLLGTGPAGVALAGLFDDWVPYAQPHADYIRAVLPRAFAFVSGLLGLTEAMGLIVAEAQCAGAAIASWDHSIKPAMLCPAAHVAYEEDDAESLAAALVEARKRDPDAIRTQAAERFDYAAVAARTRAAIGL